MTQPVTSAAFGDYFRRARAGSRACGDANARMRDRPARTRTRRARTPRAWWRSRAGMWGVVRPSTTL